MNVIRNSQKDSGLNRTLSSDGKSFKTRDDFSSVDEYARYIKENIKVGVMVKCCEAYEEVRHGDIGRVMKVSMTAAMPSNNCTL